MRVIKRDGRVVDFDKERIKSAIFSAFSSINPGDFNFNTTVSTGATSHVVDTLLKMGRDEIEVETIQDIVEKTLMEDGFTTTAAAFIKYRTKRQMCRERKTSLMDKFSDICFTDASHSEVKRENANIDGNTAMGAMLKFGSEGAKEFYDLCLIPEEFVVAHREGDIHIHDKDFYGYTTTCTQIDTKKLFKDGFNTGHGFLREPNSIQSYAALACIAIQSNQNDQHGGQAIVNFDYTMAEGVRKSFIKEICNVLTTLCFSLSQEDLDYFLKDVKSSLNSYEGSLLSEEGLNYVRRILNFPSFICYPSSDHIIEVALRFTDRDTYQAMESLIHNLNTMHSRAGAQTPFSSLNYGLDTSPEARMAIKNLLLATEAGLGGGETPIFPIQIFRVKAGVNLNPGDPNYDLFQLACRVTAKRMFPNFSNQDAPFNLQYYKGTPETEISYMGCRTRVIGNVVDPEKAISNGRGNLSFTSINLPRLALESHGDIDLFLRKLDEMMEFVAGQLLHRFGVQCKKRVKDFPFLMGNHVWIDSEKLSEDDTLEEVLKHGTLSIGFIGLAETLVSLTGHHHGEDPKSQELGIQIVKHMREKTDELSKRYSLNFTLLATPAEGLSGRFVNIDKKKFGIIPGVTDRDYYTNSFHIPVYYPISATKKIDLEAPYHAFTNAGHITYVEVDGDLTKNPKAIEDIVRYMHDKGIGYGSINHPIDRDPVCGYNGIINDVCPKCGRRESDDGIEFERIRRITGYLVGTTNRWNSAKRAEERDRVKHIAFGDFNRHED